MDGVATELAVNHRNSSIAESKCGHEQYFRNDRLKYILTGKRCSISLASITLLFDFLGQYGQPTFLQRTFNESTYSKEKNFG